MKSFKSVILLITDKCPNQQKSEVDFCSLGYSWHSSGTPSASLHGYTSESIKTRWQQLPQTLTYILLQQLEVQRHWQPRLATVWGEVYQAGTTSPGQEVCRAQQDGSSHTHTDQRRNRPAGCLDPAAEISHTVGVPLAWMKTAVLLAKPLTQNREWLQNPVGIQVKGQPVHYSPLRWAAPPVHMPVCVGRGGKPNPVRMRGSCSSCTALQKHNMWGRQLAWQHM